MPAGGELLTGLSYQGITSAAAAAGLSAPVCVRLQRAVNAGFTRGVDT